MHRECTRVQREFRRPKDRCLSFPLFRETTKEDAISFRGWRSKIEDALEHGHDATKVKEAMFASLEGMARDNAKLIDENRDLHVTCILDGLDSLYGVSMTDGVRSHLLQLYGANSHYLKKNATVTAMLDGSAIRPSQSPWCNALVLVRKKDGSLRFCNNFRCLNAHPNTSLAWT